MKDKCKYNLKEDVQTSSVYCGKLDQWVSSNYCKICPLKEGLASTKTSTNDISLFIRYVSTYLATYLTLSTFTKTKTHQNIPIKTFIH